MFRYLYNQKVGHMLAVIAAIYFSYYFVWRLTQTLNPDAQVFSIIFLAAEAQGILSFFLFAFMTWDVKQKLSYELVPELAVDVYVPTYDEELDILEATLTGCSLMTYPHTTYLLDDGRRPEVQRLAERFGCHYLTRPNNLYAKAGNLNAALPRTSGDFIAVLDADMVPQPDFLDRTLGYFVDASVALVQLPQEFYNQDSMQHVDRQDEGFEGWHTLPRDAAAHGRAGERP